jgi:hypothetical protein
MESLVEGNFMIRSLTSTTTLPQKVDERETRSPRLNGKYLDGTDAF